MATAKVTPPSSPQHQYTGNLIESLTRTVEEIQSRPGPLTIDEIISRVQEREGRSS